MIVLDTNVVSEIMRPAPAPSVLRWIRLRALHDLHITALTCAETLRGVALMPDGIRRRDLVARVELFFGRQFAGRVLSFDFAAAEAFAQIAATRSAAGRPIGTVDAVIAAVAPANGATIATRDAGFAGCGVPLIDPWTAA